MQCGICIPGMVLAAKALLDRDAAARPPRTSAQGLAGNLCRCTGYTKIFEAVARAAGVGLAASPARAAAARVGRAGYFRPRSLEEALEILAQRRGRGAADRRRHRHPGRGQGRHSATAAALFDLTAVPELKGIEERRRPRLDRRRHARTPR